MANDAKLVKHKHGKKLKKGEFYDRAPILALDATYNFIYGGRSNGKSYSVKEWAIDEFARTGKQFGYVRRWKEDVTQGLVRQYFADNDIDTLTGGEYNLIDAGRGILEISKYNIETEKKSNRKTCGFYFPISKASRFASTQYPNLTNLIIEEVIPIDGRYVPQEMELLNHLISTILRSKPDARVFFICNSISRQSPYWEEYGITDLVRNQNIGDLDLVERKTKDGPQRIAVEYSYPKPEGNKLFAGKRETMNVEGKWLADPHPHIDDITNWNTIYTFYVKCKAARYKCRYLVRGIEYTIYVEPVDSIPDTGRVVSDEFSFSPYNTVGFKPMTPYEAAVFECIPTKCCYSDDLTGTEFEEIVENFVNNA